VQRGKQAPPAITGDEAQIFIRAGTLTSASDESY